MSAFPTIVLARCWTAGQRLSRQYSFQQDQIRLLSLQYTQATLYVWAPRLRQCGLVDHPVQPSLRARCLRPRPDQSVDRTAGGEPAPRPASHNWKTDASLTVPIKNNSLRRPCAAGVIPPLARRPDLLEWGRRTGVPAARGGWSRRAESHARFRAQRGLQELSALWASASSLNGSTTVTSSLSVLITCSTSDYTSTYLNKAGRRRLLVSPTNGS